MSHLHFPKIHTIAMPQLRNASQSDASYPLLPLHVLSYTASAARIATIHALASSHSAKSLTEAHVGRQEVRPDVLQLPARRRHFWRPSTCTIPSRAATICSISRQQRNQRSIISPLLLRSVSCKFPPLIQLRIPKYLAHSPHRERSEDPFTTACGKGRRVPACIVPLRRPKDLARYAPKYAPCRCNPSRFASVLKECRRRTILHCTCPTSAHERTIGSRKN
jgi:hypothetical protein